MALMPLALYSQVWCQVGRVRGRRGRVELRQAGGDVGLGPVRAALVVHGRRVRVQLRPSCASQAGTQAAYRSCERY